MIAHSSVHSLVRPCAVLTCPELVERQSVCVCAMMLLELLPDSLMECTTFAPPIMALGCLLLLLYHRSRAGRGGRAGTLVGTALLPSGAATNGLHDAEVASRWARAWGEPPRRTEQSVQAQSFSHYPRTPARTSYTPTLHTQPHPHCHTHTPTHTPTHTHTHTHMAPAAPKFSHRQPQRTVRPHDRAAAAGVVGRRPQGVTTTLRTTTLRAAGDDREQTVAELTNAPWATSAAAAAAAVSRAVASKPISAPELDARSKLATGGSLSQGDEMGDEYCSVEDSDGLGLDATGQCMVDEDGLPLRYDKNMIESYWRNQRSALTKRWTEFLGKAVPFLTTLVRIGFSDGATGISEQAGPLAEQARRICEDLGPTYVKVGQMLSVRPDVLPPEALVELSKLQDAVPPFDSQEATRQLAASLRTRSVVRRLFARDQQTDGAEAGGQGGEGAIDQASDEVVIKYVFDEIDLVKPVAAASLAQVYRATLSQTMVDEGVFSNKGESIRVVAVKVQRPNIRSVVSKDLYVLRRAAEVTQGLISQFAPQQRTDYVALLNAWAVGFYTELDFLNEAANQQALIDALDDVISQDIAPRPGTAVQDSTSTTMDFNTDVDDTDDGIQIVGDDDPDPSTSTTTTIENGSTTTTDNATAAAAAASTVVNATEGASRASNSTQQLQSIKIPAVCAALSSRALLVSEWVDGVKLSECEPEQINELIPSAQEVFLVQLLQLGFFHGDPHPGNLLRTPDGRLCLLDFGLMARIDEQDRDGMVSALIHLANRDYAALVDDFVALGILPPDCNRRLVTPLMDKALSPYVKGGGAQAYATRVAESYGMDINNLASNSEALGATAGGFSAMTRDALTVLNDIPFTIPPYFALLARAIIALEGIALTGDPSYGIVGASYPFVARRLLSSERPAVQQALQELLYGSMSGGGAGAAAGVRQRGVRLAALLNAGIGASDAGGAGGESAAFVDLDRVPDNAVENLGAALQLLLSPRAGPLRTLLADEAVDAADLLLRQGARKARDALSDPVGLVSRLAQDLLPPSPLDALRNAVPAPAGGLGLLGALLPTPRLPQLPVPPLPPVPLVLPQTADQAVASAGSAGSGPNAAAVAAVASSVKLVPVDTLLDAVAPPLSREEELYALALVDLVGELLGPDAAAVARGDALENPAAAAVVASAVLDTVEDDSNVLRLAKTVAQAAVRDRGAGLVSVDGLDLSAELKTAVDGLTEPEREVVGTLGDGVVDALRSRLMDRLESLR